MWGSHIYGHLLGSWIGLGCSQSPRKWKILNKGEMSSSVHLNNRLLTCSGRPDTRCAPGLNWTFFLFYFSRSGFNLFRQFSNFFAI